MANPYWARLAESSSTVKDDLDRVLDQLGVRPVGTGYIDVIVPTAQAEDFLASMTSIGVAAYCVTLWCESSEINKQRLGCPHGMGGPVHRGVWYSEMCERDPFNVADHGICMDQSDLDASALAQECNALALTYVRSGIQGRPEFSPCLAPGFWLAVPENWHSSSQSVVA